MRYIVQFRKNIYTVWYFSVFASIICSSGCQYFIQFLYCSCSTRLLLCLELTISWDIFYRYLSALISQSFLDIGSLSRILDSIMKLCLQFCWSIENQESGEITSELEHITEVHQAIMFFSSRVFIFFWFLTWQVSSKQRHSQVNFMMFWANLNGFSVYLVQEFNKKSNSLYTILRSSRLIGSQRAPYLRRFLMRLNFNFFFEVIRWKGSLYSSFSFSPKLF